MLKIFTTQFSGIMNKIATNEEAIEDSARLLAQATITEGTIYLYCSNELEVIISEALYSLEPLKNVVAINNENLPELQPNDRFIIATRTNEDEEARFLAKAIQAQHGSAIGISTIVSEDKDGLEELVDVHIDLHCKKGLVPDEYGNRVANPTSLAALVTFFGIRLALNEILAELD